MFGKPVYIYATNKDELTCNGRCYPTIASNTTINLEWNYQENKEDIIVVSTDSSKYSSSTKMVVKKGRLFNAQLTKYNSRETKKSCIRSELCTLL